MKTEKKMSQSDEHGLSDEPQLSRKTSRVLSAMAMENLNSEQQIDCITKTIISTAEENTGVIKLLPLLRNCFNDGLKFFYREKLRTIYSEIVKSGRPGFPDFALELKRAILREILAGWRWWPEKDKGLGMETDAETCLCFVCDSHNNAASKKLKDYIEKLFHDYFDDYVGSDPTPWIEKDYLPEEIRIILLQKRIRQNPFLVIQEIKLCQAFDLHNRSEEVVRAAREFLQELRQTEESTKELEEKIHDIAKTNQLGEISTHSSSKIDGVVSVTLTKIFTSDEYAQIYRRFEKECRQITDKCFLPPSKIHILLKRPDGTII